mgnify:CR=1 FL=1
MAKKLSEKQMAALKKGQEALKKKREAQSAKKGGKVGKPTKAGFQKVLRTSKPDDSFTIEELKNYIRKNKLNMPKIKLGQKKAGLRADLKKHGHYK